MGILWQDSGLRITDDFLCNGTDYLENTRNAGIMQYGAEFTIQENTVFRGIEGTNERWGYYIEQVQFTELTTAYRLTNGAGSIVYPSGSQYEAKLPRILYNDAGYFPPQTGTVDMVGGTIGTEQLGTFSSNAPIFLTREELIDYINTGAGLTQAINYDAQTEELEGEEFSITNIGVNGTWTPYGVGFNGAYKYRNVKGKIHEGKLAFYPISGIVDDTLKYGVIQTGTLVGCQYSVDGITWQDTDTFPFDFFYRERDKELGTFDFGLTFNYESIPIFADEDTAQGYIDGDVEVTEATNWQSISGYYPITNGTEEGETSTEMGEVYTKGFFTQQYILGESAIQEIANNLFDTSSGTSSMWENIKKGLEMYGENPMNAVMGLAYYPLNLNTVFAGHVQSQNYIYFGGYKLDLSSSISKIIYPNGYKSLGTMRILPQFKSYMDYEPYCKLYVSLPYVGTYQLDLARYYNKTTEVRYYFDTRTNTCCACLLADGLLTDYFNGQIAVSMPITLTDFSAYANTQIGTLLGGISGGGNTVYNNGSNAYTEIATKNPSEFAKLNYMSSIVGGEFAIAGSVAKTTYGLAQNTTSDFNVTKGTSTSMINEYLPQYVTFMFEYIETEESPNLRSLYGKPSNASGSVNNFSGFLQCESVNLQCSNATDTEKAEITSYLMSGIYI